MFQQTQNPVSRAIILTGLQGLAKHCGVTYVAVRKWERTRVPAERVLQIERATKGKVSRTELRPDLYPPEEYAEEDSQG